MSTFKNKKANVFVKLFTIFVMIVLIVGFLLPLLGFFFGR